MTDVPAVDPVTAADVVAFYVAVPVPAVGVVSVLPVTNGASALESRSARFDVL